MDKAEVFSHPNKSFFYIIQIQLSAIISCEVLTIIPSKPEKWFCIAAFTPFDKYICLKKKKC